MIIVVQHHGQDVFTVLATVADTQEVKSQSWFVLQYAHINICLN